MIYLDYAANTPVDSEVLKVFNEATVKYIANPNSTHPLGILAKEKIDSSSKEIAKYFNMESKGVIYTSGSSEANNLVIKGICELRKNLGNKIIISSLEHSSIVAPLNYLASKGFDVSIITITQEGIIDLNELKKEMDDNVILVSICSVDSELGTIQPIEKIKEIVKQYPNCVLHTDATQAIGKVNIDFSGVDFITFTPHKFYGLNGSGVLLNVNNLKLIPLIHGGKSTTIYRSGTPVTANVIALSKALSISLQKLDERYKYIEKLNKYLREELTKIPSIHINSPISSIPHILNISLVDKDSNKVILELEKRGICVSKTTACSIGNMSKSVLSITHNETLASNTIRISISHLTTKDELDTFLNTLKELLN